MEDDFRAGANKYRYLVFVLSKRHPSLICALLSVEFSRSSLGSFLWNISTHTYLHLGDLYA